MYALICDFENENTQVFYDHFLKMHVSSLATAHLNIVIKHDLFYL